MCISIISFHSQSQPLYSNSSETEILDLLHVYEGCYEVYVISLSPTLKCMSKCLFYLTSALIVQFLPHSDEIAFKGVY